MSEAPVRFGIVGTGGIASAFARDLELLDEATVVAVGSRTQDSARRFASEHDVATAHGSYAELVQDDDVDVVYVATPHPGHAGAAHLAIVAGKHLLVEKPFAMDAAEATAVVEAAAAAGTFVMEAMWARFLPHMVRVRELVAEGVLGEITTVMADHGQYFDFDPKHRLFAPELGGGALLDLGIYPVSFASMLLGTPQRVTARSSPTSTGVDAQTSVLLEHENGAHAVLSTTLRARTATRACVVGTDGRIEIDSDFYAPTTFTVLPRDGKPWRYDEPHEGHGLRHQAAEVVRCVRLGLSESPTLPLAETISIMATMDEILSQIGLTYPNHP